MCQSKERSYKKSGPKFIELKIVRLKTKINEK